MMFNWIETLLGILGLRPAAQPIPVPVTPPSRPAR